MKSNRRDFFIRGPVVLHCLAFRVGVQPEAKFNELQKGKYQIVIDESVPEVMQDPLFARSIAACTGKNGAIYSMPVASRSAIGIFYNNG